MKPKRQILGSCQRTETAMEHESDGNTIGSWCLWERGNWKSEEELRPSNFKIS